LCNPAAEEPAFFVVVRDVRTVVFIILWGKGRPCFYIVVFVVVDRGLLAIRFRMSVRGELSRFVDFVW
jgi:hypothetical protein